MSACPAAGAPAPGSAAQAVWAGPLASAWGALAVEASGLALGALPSPSRAHLLIELSRKPKKPTPMIWNTMVTAVSDVVTGVMSP